MILLRGSTRNLTETNQKLFWAGDRNPAGKPVWGAGLGTCVVWGAGYRAVVNPAAQPPARTAFTLIELLVVVFIGLIIFATAWPTHKGVKVRSTQVKCQNQLRQIGLGLFLYAQEHQDAFPWQEANNGVGSENLGSAAGQFAKLTNYVAAPRLFLCPADKQRTESTNFANFYNANLSYFAALVSLLSVSNQPGMDILAGDRHLSDASNPLASGLFVVREARTMNWTEELHFDPKAGAMGALLFLDGHSEKVPAKLLWQKFEASARNTNRLLIP
jgi:prepilin-type N-terminal cleavage/methylation domain-containing protein